METSFSRQSIVLVLTTKNNQTQHYIHQKHKRETEKTALANKTIYTLIWYGFYYLRSGNAVGPILTAPKPTRGTCVHTVVTVIPRTNECLTSCFIGCVILIKKILTKIPKIFQHHRHRRHHSKRPYNVLALCPKKRPPFYFSNNSVIN